jgi:DNA-3-methyladenine glycosylase II
VPEAGDVPAYWAQAKQELSAVDPVLAGFISRYDGEVLATRGDLFFTLLRSIVGQQISGKAAAAIWDRVVSLVGEVTPHHVLAHPFDELRECGLSNSKTRYIVGISEAFQAGFGERRWEDLSDEQVVAKLCELKGVGVWTAEMILIFTFLRPDVFPVGDLGVVRGIERLYNDGEELTKAELLDLSEGWRPWRTVATWYLWRSLDAEPVEY